MDPLTISLLALAGAGSALMAWYARKVGRDQETRRLLVAPLATPAGSTVSLFDLFWDLGADEFALAIMAHHRLLCPEAGRAEAQLRDALDSYGSYQDFVRIGRSATQDLDDPGVVRGSRRTIALMLESVDRKLLALEGESAPGRAVSVSVPYAETEGAEIARRMAARLGGSGTALVQPPDGEIDVDAALETDIASILGSLLSGGGELGRWFKLREARKRRDELDVALMQMYDAFAEYLRSNANGLAPLYGVADTWDAEASRLAALAAARPWIDEHWAVCADALARRALELASELAVKARREISAYLEELDRLGRSDKPRAGYMVYLNRYALFAGQLTRCQQPAEQLERATHHLKTELRARRREGLL